MPVDHVSVGTAARMVGVSPRTFRRWIAEGHADAVRLPSGRYIVPKTTIDKLMRPYVSKGDSRTIH